MKGFCSTQYWRETKKLCTFLKWLFFFLNISQLCSWSMEGNPRIFFLFCFSNADVKLDSLEKCDFLLFPALEFFSHKKKSWDMMLKKLDEWVPEDSSSSRENPFWGASAAAPDIQRPAISWRRLMTPRERFPQRDPFLVVNFRLKKPGGGKSAFLRCNFLFHSRHHQNFSSTLGGKINVRQKKNIIYLPLEPLSVFQDKFTNCKN